MATPYTLKKLLKGAEFSAVLSRTRAALSAQGFGVPMEMDMQATFKAKLGQDSPPKVLLGACMPKIAWDVLQLEPEIAALLPCNVVVSAVDGGVEVMAVRPTQLFTLTALRDVSAAKQVEDKLAAALEAL